MQKIRKGLQEKLNLISKIQNNLKIKKYQIKKPRQKQTLPGLPHLTRNETQSEKNEETFDQIADPQKQKKTWLRIKKIQGEGIRLTNKGIDSLTPESNKSPQPKILLASSYTSRFSSKVSPVKFNELQECKNDKRYMDEFLRKTYLEKINSPFKSNYNKSQQSKLNQSIMRNGSRIYDKNEPQYTFYGKINDINHVTGKKFKTLDPRFGGLTREEIKERIRNRSLRLERNYGGNSAQPTSSLNIYDSQTKFNTVQNKQQSFNRYGKDREIQLSLSDRRHNKKNSSKKRKNELYSPWQHQQSQGPQWEQLSKIEK